jgi:hypothetical protein
MNLYDRFLEMNPHKQLLIDKYIHDLSLSDIDRIVISEQIINIQINPFCIAHLHLSHLPGEFQLEEFQLFAASLNGHVLKYLKSPSNKVLEVAINTTPQAVQWLHESSPQLPPHLQMVVVKDDPKYIRYINNPCEQAQVTAIMMLPDAINLIKSPTQAAILISKLEA